MTEHLSLLALGWRPFFQQQLTLDEITDYTPARIVEQHKSILMLMTESGLISLSLMPSMPEMVVGDWILLDDQQQFYRLLERNTYFKRKAAGTKVDWQLISANVDTAFIVSSINEDFNLNRIERYLSLVNEAGAEPVVLLSKSDLSNAPEDYIEQVQRLDNQLLVELINCHDSNAVTQLQHWLKTGQTVVVLGSSGVGKSTLINTLLGQQSQATGDIREDDAKGRHTTTSRSLISTPSGGLILDTPGMREIQLADCKEGIASTFADIESLAEQCRYNDCQHENEPGCAVISAVENGEIDQRRLNNYRKLLKEEMLNSASLSDKRAQDKALGKFYKRTLVESKKLKGR